MSSVVENVSNPLELLGRWLGEAQAAGLPEPSAMALGTTSVDGWPSVRIVLCRGVDERRGVRFFTNYESRKGRELDATGRAAATFHWATLERQVRVEGRVERATPEESDGYFHARPRGSQIASAVSPQSRPIASLQELRDRCTELSARSEGREVERPSWWGGYWIVARAVELCTAARIACTTAFDTSSMAARGAASASGHDAAPILFGAIDFAPEAGESVFDDDPSYRDGFAGALVLALGQCGPSLWSTVQERGAEDLRCPVEQVSAYPGPAGGYVARGCGRWAEYDCISDLRASSSSICVPRRQADVYQDITGRPTDPTR